MACAVGLAQSHVDDDDDDDDDNDDDDDDDDDECDHNALHKPPAQLC